MDLMRCTVQLFLGTDTVIAQAVEVAIDEFDRLENSAGRFAFPNLPKAAGAERFNEAIAANGFGIQLFFEGHSNFSYDRGQRAFRHKGRS